VDPQSEVLQPGYFNLYDGDRHPRYNTTVNGIDLFVEKKMKSPILDECQAANNLIDKKIPGLVKNQIDDIREFYDPVSLFNH
jgi:hypothetical protein